MLIARKAARGAHLSFLGPLGRTLALGVGGGCRAGGGQGSPCCYTGLVRAPLLMGSGFAAIKICCC